MSIKSIFINEAAYVEGVSTELSAEISNRISGDSSLSTAVSTEASTRGSADTSLSTALSTRVLADTSLSTAISTEASTRGTADTSLSTAISTSTSGVGSLSTAISTEASTRGTADTSLSTAISTEASTRGTADTSLSTALSTRVSVDTSLSTAVSTEISTRGSQATSLSTVISSTVSGVDSLSTSVSTEASTRGAADTSLSTAVSSRVSADSSLSTAVSTEASTRGTADTSLSTAITTEESIRSSVDASLSTAISSSGGGVTINNNVDDYILTASGTANTIDGESNLRFNGSILTLTGDMTLSSGANRTVGIAARSNSSIYTISLIGQAGSSETYMVGGATYIRGGAGWSRTSGAGNAGNAGATYIYGGTGGYVSDVGGPGVGGAVTVQGGTGGYVVGAASGGNGGHLYLRGGDAGTGGAANGTNGNVYIYGGITSSTYGDVYLCNNGTTNYGSLYIGGNVIFTTGANRTISIAGASISNAYDLTIQAQTTTATSAVGGHLYLKGGDGLQTSSVGGNVYVYGGDGYSSGDGDVFLANNGTNDYGQVFFASGAVGTPSISFRADSDTGLFYAATYIGVAIGGTEDFRFVDGGVFHADSDIIAYSTTISDIRLKNINSYLDDENVLDIIKNLKTIKYEWKHKKDGVHIGFIAQDMEKYVPEIVVEHNLLSSKDDELYKTIRYSEFIPYLTAAIKKQQEIIENQQKEIDDLKKYLKK